MKIGRKFIEENAYCLCLLIGCQAFKELDIQGSSIIRTYCGNGIYPDRVCSDLGLCDGCI
jgi:hypothetical protein